MTTGAHQEPRILVCGEDALVVEFGDGIDPLTNDRVYALAAAVEAAVNASVTEMVPTYRSLLIQYDLELSTVEEMTEFLVALIPSADQAGNNETNASRRIYKLPVSYGGEQGQDLNDVAEHAGMTAEEVIAIHSGTDYRVFMLGFAPGFPYLGGMDERIGTPRLASPRVRVPAGSVGIAETQTGVYPMASPGGWRLIGNTPVSLFEPNANPPVPFLPGSFIRFVPVTAEEAERIAQEVADGTYLVQMTEQSS
ncbi:MAG TPA: 5-oxoprolinase subunit PxpB [Dehalococcoidia bacterium]|nr:allophanate hydrolase [Chloroflexota bacterium]MDP5876711.1 5-oxoprolinase subunit PxpB [Dehalococcoidia bacterium]MDP6273377.1 5-oxoprolinase subunit PxpB [Dehalococcoidia bacterium]MDP7160776.1 5-oxoprolinase subunit PxpB [Dehalococcoidia bacterium]MDP7213295.1 5-oxoprolinase subunit PxpB [Dehalococcoidia bacterium]